MEQRKLIRLGNSSFAIALPKDWVDKSGLKKGDNIFVERNNNGEMLISSQFKKINEGKKAVINVDGKDESKIKREFTSDYIRGNSVFEFSEEDYARQGLVDGAEETLEFLVGKKDFLYIVTRGELEIQQRKINSTF